MKCPYNLIPAMYVTAQGETRYAIIDSVSLGLIEEDFWTPEEAMYTYGLFEEF